RIKLSKLYLERAIAHFETSDENFHSLFLEVTFVISYSLVVQFSKINVSSFVAVVCFSSDLYNISQRPRFSQPFFRFLFSADLRLLCSASLCQRDEL
ncbi:hypothetical protein, partial [Paenibacillus sp. FSL H8-0259]|uniref:hypothetical protein n=1 Tax=Paenibacillus sp. FSL H8-0259 TaxID=1920423 RepID=UPI001C4AAF7A